LAAVEVGGHPVGGGEIGGGSGGEDGGAEDDGIGGGVLTGNDHVGEADIAGVGKSGGVGEEAADGGGGGWAGLGDGDGWGSGEQAERGIVIGNGGALASALAGGEERIGDAAGIGGCGVVAAKTGEGSGLESVETEDRGIGWLARALHHDIGERDVSGISDRAGEIEDLSGRDGLGRAELGDEDGGAGNDGASAGGVSDHLSAAATDGGGGELDGEFAGVDGGGESSAEIGHGAGGEGGCGEDDGIWGGLIADDDDISEGD